ncbi:hypothetical protein EVAR_41429_1 [Eumeta japonica]|uniref:Uncharacterized protein n=1 Tax=Eumeta variegata TaxID=151549 RepID=A0A4C1W3J1_EUMVA|nr:hypothetical protein EVAR_41429_1 [Eumeta japonica]
MENKAYRRRCTQTSKPDGGPRNVYFDGDAFPVDHETRDMYKTSSRPGSGCVGVECILVPVSFLSHFFSGASSSFQDIQRLVIGLSNTQRDRAVSPLRRGSRTLFVNATPRSSNNNSNVMRQWVTQRILLDAESERAPQSTNIHRWRSRS